MSEFKFSCPFCEQHLQCDNRMSGRQIKCPSCDHLIHVPPAPGQTAAANYTPESGKTWATFIAPPNVEKPKGLGLEGKPPPQSPKT